MAMVVKHVSAIPIFSDKMSAILRAMIKGKKFQNEKLLSCVQTRDFHWSLGNKKLVSTNITSIALRRKQLFENVISFSYLSQVICVKQYAMKRKKFNFPELKAEDLQESFVRGSGPGGQAVNQTSNCVVLKHIPSGIVVKCQETRSLDENRKIARMRMEEKLDLELHGDQSYLSLQQSEHRKEKLNRRKKAKDKLAMKKAFKEGVKED